MTAPSSLLAGLAARLIPVAERDAVLGDLREEGVAAGSAAETRALLGVAVHFHVEAWRDERARVGGALCLALGVGIWWAVDAVVAAAGVVDVEYLDPLSNLALRFWSAPHLSASLAAGLMVGHAPWLPDAARPTRWHVAAALAVTAALKAPAGSALLSAALLLGAVWIGDRGLRLASD